MPSVLLNEVLAGSRVNRFVFIYQVISFSFDKKLFCVSEDMRRIKSGIMAKVGSHESWKFRISILR